MFKIISKKTLTKKLAPLLAATGLIVAGGLVYADQADGHGYVQSPSSRANLGAANNVGSVQYEPQSLEAPKGFPTAGPADGKIASAGGMFGGILDEQTSSRWIKHDMVGGVNEITWYHTAPHRTTKWHYYITKKDWDPNSPLKRSDLEFIGSFDGNGTQPTKTVTHKVNIPTDRSGYHVILAVWDIADTANAFYQVIDVNLKNGEAAPGAEIKVDTEKPTAATGLYATKIATNSVDLTWNPATDNVGVDHYVIYRGDNIGSAQQIATSDTTSFTDTTVTQGGIYTYYVTAVDKAGNVSDSSNVIVINIPIKEENTAPDTEKPAIVTGLHAMSVQYNSVDLMWSAGIDNVGVDRYLVYRDGTIIGTTTATSYTDQTVAAETTYFYTIVAVDAAGNSSDRSSSLTITTPVAPTTPVVPETPVAPTTPVAPDSSIKEWSATGLYTVGTKVSYLGNVYEARVTYVGYGDTNWNPESALSLWKLAN